MTDTTLSLPQRRTRPPSNEQLAWGVLLVAFGAFCVILLVIVIGVHFFLFESTIALQTTLRVSRGTAVVIGSDFVEQAVRTERGVFNSAVLTTDPQSQGVVLVRDPYDTQRPIAAITLLDGARVDLRQAARPRFEWGSDPYWIDIADINGRIDVYIPPDLRRSVVVHAATAFGVAVRMEGAGMYTLDATSQGLRVTNVRGSAFFIYPSRETVPITVGQRVVYDAAQVVTTTERALGSLLGSATFTPGSIIDYNAPTDQTRPFVWRCNNWQNTPPLGAYGLSIDDGRPSLRLFRGNGAVSHGETVCVQGFGTSGLDVSMFTHLSVRAVFRINSHTLSACGVAGSECPLMLRMDYYPQQGAVPQTVTPQTWYHGFFSTFNPQLGLPLRCDSCAEQHKIVNAGAWYTYQSENLLTLLPAQRPASLLNFRFYASGHEYDVVVHEMALMVDQGTIPLPVIGANGG